MELLPTSPGLTSPGPISPGPISPGEPPAPSPIRWWERWRVAWHGRRDARLRAIDADLPRPYLDALRAQAQAGQRSVSGWLHDKIAPVDVEAVRILTLLEQFRRDPVSRPSPTLIKPRPTNPDSQPADRIPDWLVEARQAAAAVQAYQRRITEQNVAEQQLGQLGTIRHHVIEVARAAAGAHLARYEELVGIYEAALLRRHPNRTPAGTPDAPTLLAPPVAAEPWVHGDLPMLALEVDGDLAESYRWFLKDFATRTSAAAIEHPFPIQVPRVG
ncbi:MAG: hypothetical protein ACT4NY_32755 [Pseudonocardiales bacterium]